VDVKPICKLADDHQTAYHIENKKAGVSLQGHSGQKTTFSGTSMSGMLLSLWSEFLLNIQLSNPVMLS